MIVAFLKTSEIEILGNSFPQPDERLHGLVNKLN